MFSRKRAHAERKQCWLRWLRSEILSKMAEDGEGEYLMTEFSFLGELTL